jgi:hypothetical protein
LSRDDDSVRLIESCRYCAVVGSQIDGGIQIRDAA